MPSAEWNGDDMYVKPDVCPKCNDFHWKKLSTGNRRAKYRTGSPQTGRRTCIGHRKSDGKACTSWPIPGSNVCINHGGRAPQVRRKASANMEYWEEMRRVTQGLTSAGIDLEQKDPIRELLWAVATSSHAVKWLGYKVAELVTPDVSGDPTADVIGIDDEGNPRRPTQAQLLYAADEQGTFRTHPLWKEWNAERQRHARFAKLAVDAGVSERMIRIAEAQSEIIVETMLYALDQLRLGPEIKEQAVDIIAARFREIEASSAPLGLSRI